MLDFSKDAARILAACQVSLRRISKFPGLFLLPFRYLTCPFCPSPERQNVRPPWYAISMIEIQNETGEWVPWDFADADAKIDIEWAILNGENGKVVKENG